jgi:hypothetical protein
MYGAWGLIIKGTLSMVPYQRYRDMTTNTAIAKTLPLDSSIQMFLTRESSGNKYFFAEIN